MNPHDNPSPLDDALADLVLQGPEALAPDARAPLAEPATRADHAALEIAAARLQTALVASLEPAEPLPEHLAASTQRQAAAFFAGRLRALALPQPPTPPARGLRLAAWSGWLTAAAALVALAVALPRSSTPPAPAIAAAPPSLADRMASLARIAQPLPLNRTGHPLAQGATGQFLWDPSSQQGYLRIEGLAPVDPRQGAYQLWLIDASRPDLEPVDGGVFAIARDDQPTIVPIRAALAVQRPALLAITLEPPGGVVVSDRNRILLTGQPAPPP